MPKKIMIEALEKLYNKGEVIEEQVGGGPAIPLPTKPPAKPKPLAIESDKEIEEREDPSSEADKERAEEEYGNVHFADEKNKKYPVDLKHVQAAISYFSMPKNYKKYSPSERKSIAKNIAAAAEKFGKDVSGFRKNFGI